MPSSHSRLDAIPGSAALKKKRDLFPVRPPASPGSHALPHLPGLGRTRYQSLGPGILPRFPFDRGGAYDHVQRPALVTEFSCVLGPTHPRSIAVHVEPFSPSVFKG